MCISWCADQMINISYFDTQWGQKIFTYSASYSLRTKVLF